MIYEDLLSSFRGKRICLVGGAPEWYPGFDYRDRDWLFATVNNHGIGKTFQSDLIFTSGCEPIDMILLAHRPKIFACIDSPNFSDVFLRCLVSYLDLYGYLSSRYLKANPHGIEHEHWNAFNNRLRTKPFTGISAIRLLLDYPIEELYVTGMNFYQECNRGLPYKRGPHLIEPQRAWLAEVAHCDKRVRLDDTLQKICTYEEPEEKRIHFIREGETLWPA